MYHLYDSSFCNWKQKMHEYTSLQDSLASGTFYHAVYLFTKKGYQYMFFCCNNLQFVEAPLCRPCGPAKRKNCSFLFIYTFFFFVYPYHGCAAKNKIFLWSKLFTDIFIEFIQLIRVIIKQLLKHVAWAWRLPLSMH